MSSASQGSAYDYWVFDLDGTLVDTEWRYKRDLFDRVGYRLGVGFSDDFVTDLWYGLGGSRDVLLAAKGLDPEEFWSIFDDLDDPQARAGASFLYSDAAWIGGLDVPAGIVTHCPEPITEQVIRTLDISDWFTTVVPCNDTTGWKPDPAPVRHAIDDLRVSDESTGVMVGDGESDIGAAHNAGVAGAHVERHDPNRRGRCVLGDYRVTDLEELATRLSTTPQTPDTPARKKTD